MKYLAVILFSAALIGRGDYSCDKEANKGGDIIAIENLNTSNPNLKNDNLRAYYTLGINQLLDTSERKEEEIEQLYYSICAYLSKDSCMNLTDKTQLISSIDSLRTSFDFYLNSSQSIEYLSYGNGKQAGVRAMVHRIHLQNELIEYMKYWFGSFYFVYLEPGVWDCK